MSNAYQVPRHHSNLFKGQILKDPTPKDPGFAQEVFHRMYAEVPRVLPESAGNATRHAMHKLISELPEFDVLRHSTTRDPMWAAMATQAMGKSIASKMPTSANVERANAILEGLQSLQDDASQGDNHDVFDNAVGAAMTALEAAIALDASQAQSLDESALRQAMRAGIATAQADIAQAEATLSMLGYGVGSAAPSPNTYTNPEVALELARKVKSSPQLSAIIELAGRLIPTARAKKAQRTEFSRSEVVGVEQTNDIGHLLGSEIALLADPDMCDDLLLRVIEKRALGYKMSGKEKLAKGPIVMMLDQSGSMAGASDTWAKAIALALYDTARADKRAFAVVTYDGRVRKITEVTSPETMLSVISETADGSSTDYEQAMTRAIGLCVTAKADIVHLTDGSAALYGGSAALASADRIGARVYGIGIGEVGPALKAWSHEVTKISDVNKDSAAMDLIFGEGGI